MGNPLFQARNHGQETANLLMIVKRLREDKRRPYARLCAGERAVFDEPVEILRRDANNGLRLSIEKNGFTDNRWIASESFFPKAVIENDDVVVASFTILGSETRTKDRIDAEQGKEIRGDSLDDNFLGLAISSEIVPHVGDISHAGENCASALPIEEIRRRNRVMRIGVLRIGFPDHYQAAWNVVRKWAEENGIDDRKNSGVCADAESEREDSDGGEARAALQHAERVTKIASALVEPANDVDGASVFLEEGGIAEAPLRFVTGILGRHSCGKVVRGAHLEVRTQLFVEFTVQSSASQQALQTSNERHRTPPLHANRRTWATA